MAFIQQSKSDDRSFAQLARLQEIFLDMLSNYCCRNSTRFLMQNQYEHALSEGELAMKRFFQKILTDINE